MVNIKLGALWKQEIIFNFSLVSESIIIIATANVMSQNHFRDLCSLKIFF